MSASSPRETTQPWLPQTELAALHNALTGAEHSKIVKLLAIADTLQRRGAVDDLIAPFRPRLAHLRPARPLRFARLLFMPLDPVIVPPAHWQPKSPLLPRSALLPMAETVCAAMGEDATRIDRMIEGHSTSDHHVVAEAGALLWPSAARLLLQAEPPSGWTEQTGLPAGLFAEIAVSTGAVLEQVLTLQTWRAEAQLGIFVGTTTLHRSCIRSASGGPRRSGCSSPCCSRGCRRWHVLRAAISEVGWAAAADMRAAMELGIAALLERLESDRGIETLILRTTLGEAVRKCAGSPG